MPRHSREQSGTGIYHVMLRGVNRQSIFEDDEDYIRFISLLNYLWKCLKTRWKRKKRKPYLTMSMIPKRETYSEGYALILISVPFRHSNGKSAILSLSRRSGVGLAFANSPDSLE